MTIVPTDREFIFRRARKAHRCSGHSTAGPCGYVIQPGERYVEGADIVNPPFGHGRYCDSCAVAQGMAEAVPA